MNTQTIPDFQETVIAFTDGSCTGNGKAESRGGVGVHFKCDIQDISVPLDDSQTKATNQRAELMAILLAVRAWAASDFKEKPLIIYSDSQYGINTCQTWMYGWFSRGQVKMNWDIVTELYAAIAPLRDRIAFVHVRGHQKITANDNEYQLFAKSGNQKADYLATAASGVPK